MFVSLFVGLHALTQGEGTKPTTQGRIQGELGVKHPCFWIFLQFARVF